MQPKTSDKLSISIMSNEHTSVRKTICSLKFVNFFPQYFDSIFWPLFCSLLLFYIGPSLALQRERYINEAKGGGI